MKTLKEKQISIYLQMQKLHRDTQTVLTDVINSFSQQELDKLDNIEITDYSFISKINKDETHTFVIGEYDMDETYLNGFDCLTQLQQKRLIDHLLLETKG